MKAKDIPFLFVLFLVFTVPWQMIVTIPALGTITRLVGFLSVAMVLLYVLIRRKVKELPVVIILMILFISWSLLSFFWSARPMGAVSRFITNLQLLAMVWLIWESVNTNREAMSVLQVFILGYYVAIIDMLISFFTGQYSEARIAATGFNPNQLAISFAIGIPIAWYLLLQRKKDFLFLLNLLYIPLSLFCIVLTASRGGLVTAVVALSIIPFTWFMCDSAKRGIVTISIFVVVLVSIIAFQSFSDSLERNIERLSMITQNIEQRDLGARQRIWEAGLRAFAERPLLGVGARSYGIAAMEAGLAGYHGAHNTYLSVLVEFGIVGFLIFILIFLFGILPHINRAGIERYFYIILFLTMVIGLMPIRWEANKITWLLFAIFFLQQAFVFRKGKLIIVRR